MDLLFKREQTTGKMGRVNFKLWGKLEVSEDEQALINRYRFDESVLIGSDDSELLRKAIKLGATYYLSKPADVSDSAAKLQAFGSDVHNTKNAPAV